MGGKIPRGGVVKAAIASVLTLIAITALRMYLSSVLYDAQ